MDGASVSAGGRRPRTRATAAAREGARRAASTAMTLGESLRSTRVRRKLTQRALGERLGVDQTRISQLERGQGVAASLELWFAAAVALDRPLRVEFGRDPHEEPVDAGHLKVQELVLRLGRAAGYRATFELPTRPADPLRSTDVGLRDDRRRRLVLVEVWNTIGDIGAAARASSRKLAEAEQFAVAIGGARPHEVRGCWVVRATKRNRELVARYPEVFAVRFPGSSRLWARALSEGTDPPAEVGLVWARVDAAGLFAWRRA